MMSAPVLIPPLDETELLEAPVRVEISHADPGQFHCALRGGQLVAIAEVRTATGTKVRCEVEVRGRLRARPIEEVRARMLRLASEAATAYDQLVPALPPGPLTVDLGRDPRAVLEAAG
jgi:hypothetical protein